VSDAPTRRAARAGYAAVLRLAVPIYWLRLHWRARREPLYAESIGERFGVYHGAAAPGALWIHAVSLGETLAAAPLIDALRKHRPELRLLLTHGTATGRAAGAPLLREGDAQAWLAVDTPGAVRRFFDHFAPVAGVLMETEVWPHLLAEARRRSVPMLLANARLSERSLRRGAKVALLLRPAFESLAAAFAQSDEDAARLRSAGVRDVSVTGNVKFDVAPQPHLTAQGRRWKDAAGRAVVLAASTREGEEAALLAAWREQAGGPLPLLVIVPRHPQRFDAVAALVTGAGLRLSRRSGWNDGPPPGPAAEADVWLGDSMREMPAYYALADIALLGGSFEPLGGQNLIEAAACGCPVVMGPHTFNFREAAELSLEAGAAVRVTDLRAGVAEALSLVDAPGRGRRDDMARRAVEFAARHRGAAARMAERIAALAYPAG
jgi:3-deoxy-D-manno-octulosonic-acid transferase